MVFSRFFQFLVKKPGFLVFSEKTEKTTNPDLNKSLIISTLKLSCNFTYARSEIMLGL